jgi:dihydrodipicolinate synthase/N-acetylneuraminate lyase
VITRDQARARWRGVLAPLVTPFTREGGIDVAALQTNVQWLLDRGARQGNTIFLLAGSGGDFPMMNLEERKQVIAAVADVVGDRAPMIAGAQSLDIRESIALGQWCEERGVEAVQISGPYYYDGRPDDVVCWLSEVARHTRVGFAIYNNWYTGYDMPLELVERLLELPNSVGVKWASPNVDIFEEGVRRFLPRVAVVNNTLNTIPGYLVGCRAFVSHWANFCPEWCWRLQELLEAGQYDAAQAAFDRAMVPYRALVAEISRQTAGEAVFVRPLMELVGLDGGVSRLPSRDVVVSAELREGFRRLLLDVGASP